MKKISPSFFALLFSSGLMLAQQPQASSEPAAATQQEQPAAKGRICASPKGASQAYENWISAQLAKDNAFANKKTSTVYTIPVIFHVVHNGEAEGTGRNISQAQLNSQITVLNQDYRNNNPSFSSWVTQSSFVSAAADCEIQFCLATKSPSGTTLPQPGIERIDRNSKGWSGPSYQGMNEPGGYIDNTIKANSIWDPTKYLNIWVLDMSDGVLGYAQFPTVPSSSTPTIGDMNGLGGPANTDGVVIQFDCIGNVGNLDPTYNKGHTTTHEVGHWLGLYHINGDASCGNDFVSDTPTQSYLSSSCPSSAGSVVASGCAASPNPPGRMYQNYMDYTADQCLAMFTTGQKQRMQACLQYCARRTSLTTSTVCATIDGIAETSGNISSVTLYPNPAAGEVSVSIEAQDASHYSISLLNTLGQTLYENTLPYASNHRTGISLAGYAPGIYFVRIKTDKGLSTKRLVVE